MHIISWAILGFIILRWGDKKDLSKFHPTMLYIVNANILYNFICKNHLMWEYEWIEGTRVDHFYMDIVYTFYFLPFTALVFLSRERKRSVSLPLYFIKWMVPYWVTEFIFRELGYFKYHNGWSIWWSLLFYFVMFPLLWVHHKRPLLTYCISVLFIVFLVAYFHIPILP